MLLNGPSELNVGERLCLRPRVDDNPKVGVIPALSDANDESMLLGNIAVQEIFMLLKLL